MRVFSPNDFVKQWRNGNLRWMSTEAVELPLAVTCPHCKEHMVLASIKEDLAPFAIIMGNFVLLIPRDLSAERLEEMWNDIIRPGFHQFVEKQRQTEALVSNEKEVPAK